LNLDDSSTRSFLESIRQHKGIPQDIVEEATQLLLNGKMPEVLTGYEHNPAADNHQPATMPSHSFGTTITGTRDTKQGKSSYPDFRPIQPEADKLPANGAAHLKASRSLPVALLIIIVVAFVTLRYFYRRPR
jgi:hypothetical protein